MHPVSHCRLVTEDHITSPVVFLIEVTADVRVPAADVSLTPGENRWSAASIFVSVNLPARSVNLPLRTAGRTSGSVQHIQADIYFSTPSVGGCLRELFINSQL